MTWRCPACHTPIRSERVGIGHDVPLQPGMVYRCWICRLELVLIDDGTKLIVDRRRQPRTP
jgi:hypothetical protein